MTQLYELEKQIYQQKYKEGYNILVHIFIMFSRKIKLIQNKYKIPKKKKKSKKCLNSFNITKTLFLFFFNTNLSLFLIFHLFEKISDKFDFLELKKGTCTTGIYSF